MLEDKEGDKFPRGKEYFPLPQGQDISRSNSTTHYLMEHFHQIVHYLAERLIQNNHILFKANYDNVTTQLYWGSFAVVVVVNIVIVVIFNVVVEVD